MFQYKLVYRILGKREKRAIGVLSRGPDLVVIHPSDFWDGKGEFVFCVLDSNAYYQLCMPII